MEEDIILKEIKILRTAIINSNEFPAFPCGHCGIGSKILAKYLVEEIGLDPKNISLTHSDSDSSINK